MARGFPFVRSATFYALLALSLQLRAQQPPVGTPLAVRRGHSGAAAQQPAGGGSGGCAMGLGSKEEEWVGSMGTYITAIDHKSGRIVWRHETNTGRGDGNNIVAYDVAPGKPLWRSRMGAVSNAPEAYLLDGHQYLLTMTGDPLFAFTI